MKARFSVLIILLANIVILSHAAIPHYHGDDMIATILHIANEEDSHEDHCSHKDGDASHDDGHCLMIDTMMASICRESDSEVEFEATDVNSLMGMAAILPCLFSILAPVTEETTTLRNKDIVLYIKDPLLRSSGLRAPPVWG